MGARGHRHRHRPGGGDRRVLTRAEQVSGQPGPALLSGSSRRAQPRPAGSAVLPRARRSWKLVAAAAVGHRRRGSGRRDQAPPSRARAGAGRCRACWPVAPAERLSADPARVGPAGGAGVQWRRALAALSPRPRDVRRPAHRLWGRRHRVPPRRRRGGRRRHDHHQARRRGDRRLLHRGRGGVRGPDRGQQAQPMRYLTHEFVSELDHPVGREQLAEDYDVEPSRRLQQRPRPARAAARGPQRRSSTTRWSRSSVPAPTSRTC